MDLKGIMCNGDQEHIIDDCGSNRNNRDKNTFGTVKQMTSIKKEFTLEPDTNLLKNYGIHFEEDDSAKTSCFEGDCDWKHNSHSVFIKSENVGDENCYLESEDSKPTVFEALTELPSVTMHSQMEPRCLVEFTEVIMPNSEGFVAPENPDHSCNSISDHKLCSDSSPSRSEATDTVEFIDASSFCESKLRLETGLKGQNSECITNTEPGNSHLHCETQTCNAEEMNGVNFEEVKPVNTISCSQNFKVNLRQVNVDVSEEIKCNINNSFEDPSLSPGFKSSQLQSCDMSWPNINISKDIPFVCKICNKTVARSGYIKRHMMMHAGKKSFTCDICWWSFPQASELARHKVKHTGEKPFSCEVCNKRFSRSCHLTVHMRSHTGEKPFTCEVCGNKFPQLCHLERHMRTHTREKPYNCAVCSMSFAQSSDLIRHKMKHTGEKPFTCDICNKRFSRSSQMKFHKKKHTGEKSEFTCELCNTSFIQACQLKRHKMIHTGEKPFGCDICNKKFNRSTHVTNHMKSHNRK